MWLDSFFLFFSCAQLINFELKLHHSLEEFFVRPDQHCLCGFFFRFICCFSFYMSLNMFFLYFFFLFSNYWCLFICNAKWSLREKDLSQWTHLKGLTPVCFLWCLVSSSDRAKRHSQPSHEQRYGFSPRKKIEFGIKMHYRKSWYL